MKPKKRSEAAKRILPQRPVIDDDVPYTPPPNPFSDKPDLLERIGSELAEATATSQNIMDVQMWRDVAWRLIHDPMPGKRAFDEDEAVSLIVDIVRYMERSDWEITVSKVPF